jgi:hypothetical protein
VNLDEHRRVLNAVGWFIPPYISLGFLGNLVNTIATGKPFTQEHLEVILSVAYSPDHLAAMVTERYPITPHVQDFAQIISESVEAHFSGLHHAAVLALMPAIEGVGRKLLAIRSLHGHGVKAVFIKLANSCKAESAAKQIGAADEIAAMMDSFIEFTGKYLYADSHAYPLTDKTNRHGALHGAFTDKDYGRPINFYKAIASIDFLCLISAFKAAISWLAPDATARSQELANYYRLCICLTRLRSRIV